MAGRQPIFWTAEHLQELAKVLISFSDPVEGQADSTRVITILDSLARRAGYKFQEKYPAVSLAVVNDGITFLGKLGFIDPGRPGVKKPGYQRFLHLTVKITPETVKQLRNKS